MPITSTTFWVRSGDADIPRVLAGPSHIAASGRRALCWSTSPRDVLQGQCVQLAAADGAARLQAQHQTAQPVRGRQADREAARKPVCMSAAASSAVNRQVRAGRAGQHPGGPALMARGAFPSSHRQNLGMPGMHGTVSAVAAPPRSDLLIALGTRFDDRVTGKLDSFAPEARSSTPTSTRRDRQNRRQRARNR